MADPNSNPTGDPVLDRFTAKWGTVTPFPSDQPQPQVQETNSDPALQRFMSKWGDVSQNAPPSGITATPNLSFSKRYGQKDEQGNIIPIDFNEAAIPSGSQYLEIAQQRDPESKLAVVNKYYPNNKARILDNGDVVMQIIDSSTGKPKEVPLNPSGVDSHDLIDLYTQAPEIASGIAAAIATKGRGLLAKTAQIIASSAASSFAGSVKDIAYRGAEGIPIRPEEIRTERNKEMLLDMFVQAGMGAAGKASRIVSPFARDIPPGSLEFDLRQGQKFFKDYFGEELKMTPGEYTGSQALRAIEAAEAPQPGARTVLGKIVNTKNAQIREIQRRAVGSFIPDEQIAEGAADVVGKYSTAIDDALAKARQLAMSKNQNQLLSEIDSAIGAPPGSSKAGIIPGVTPTMAGKETLEQFDARMAAAQANVDKAYAAVNALPGGTGDVLDGTAAAKAAMEIRKELPSVMKEVQKPTGLTDEFGAPITRTAVESQTLKTGVPEGLLKALDDLENLEGGKVSLQTLTNMKRAAFDAIAAFKTAHGDVKDRWFSKIAGAYEQGIQKGIDETGDPALKTALQKARDTYKSELLPFERPGLREMAKGEFDTRMSPQQVMERLFSGDKAIQNYQMLKEVLGEKNPAFVTLKRAWVDTRLADFTDPISGFVDHKAFERSMRSLPPEMAKEMFGNNYESIIKTLRFGQAFKDIQGIDKADLQVLMGLKNPSADDLKTILRMQKNRDTSFVSGLVSDASNGIPIAERIKPLELLNRIRNVNTPTKDVQTLLEAIGKESPEKRQALATAQLYDILDKASISDATTAGKSIAKGSFGEPEPLNLSAVGLAKALGRPGSPERIRNELILGNLPLAITPGGPNPTGKEVIENLIKVIAPSEAKSAKAFASMGGLAGGMNTAKAAQEPVKYAKTYAQKAMAALLYTSEPINKLITNRLVGPEEAAVIANGLIASEPFVRRATMAFGPEYAKSVIGELKDSIDKYVTKLQAANEPRRRERAATQRFIQGQNQPMNIQTQP